MKRYPAPALGCSFAVIFAACSVLAHPRTESVVVAVGITGAIDTFKACRNLSDEARH